MLRGQGWRSWLLPRLPVSGLAGRRREVLAGAGPVPPQLPAGQMFKTPRKVDDSRPEDTVGTACTPHFPTSPLASRSDTTQPL